MSGHTSGPWIARQSGDGIRIESEETGNYVANVHPDYVMENGSERLSDEARANAPVLAAAPELLGALKSFVAFYEEFLGKDSEDVQKTRQYHKALAVIAKAEGR